MPVRMGTCVTRGTFRETNRCADPTAEALNCRMSAQCLVAEQRGTAATRSWITTACGGSCVAGTTAGWNAATPAASRRQRGLRAAGIYRRVLEP